MVADRQNDPYLVGNQSFASVSSSLNQGNCQPTNLSGAKYEGFGANQVAEPTATYKLSQEKQSKCDQLCCQIITVTLVLALVLITIFICLMIAYIIIYHDIAQQRLTLNFNTTTTIGDGPKSFNTSQPHLMEHDDNKSESDHNDQTYSLINNLKSNSILIQNLTRICTKLKGDCWFHPTTFPHSCRRTFCESVEYDVYYDENLLKVRFRPVTSVFEIGEVPDGTPCRRGSWCIKGRCTPASQQDDVGRIEDFLLRTKYPVDGGWSNNCDNPKCLINKFDQNHHWNLFVMAAKCPGTVCTAYASGTRRLQFRSCTAPLPANGGRACDPKMPPLIWGPVCQDCPSMYGGEEARKLTPTSILTSVCGRGGKFMDKDKCSCSRPGDVPLRIEDGAPCKPFENQTFTSSGFCFFGMCLGYAGFRHICPV